MRPYVFDWSAVGPVLPDLLWGLLTTVEIAALAFACALLLGLLVVAMRVSRLAPVRTLAYAYIHLFQSLSTYIFILFVYFGLSAVAGVNLPAFPSAVLCLTMLQAAYIAEIYRAAASAIHAGQHDAAASLGLSRLQTLRDVIWPQAFRTATPMLVSQLCSAVKDSSVIAVIGGADLMRATILAVDMSHRPFELYTVAGLMYAGVVVAMGSLAAGLERAMSRHRRG
jgi:His/Glu/Gln/Arg/opine family amino acid ABC transporter permease subunit